MSLEEFLHHLQFDIDKANENNWEVDWEDAPLPYKLYRDLPVVPLSLDIPLTMEGIKAPAKPDLRRMGHFLWYVFGITQFSQSVIASDLAGQENEFLQSKRRFSPSGGGLYPNELYVYLKLEDLPTGVYHYDVAHHRLVLLREGNYDSYIDRALGNRCDVSSCFGTVFVSTIFWKNFFKYNNFSYRLQGLDAGVLMGQLLEVAKRFGMATGVYYQFLDRAMNHLLGFSEDEESVYSVIPLSVEPTNWASNDTNDDDIVSSTELCRELIAINPKHYVRSKRIKDYPMLIEMNKASILESPLLFRRIKEKERKVDYGEFVPLPQVVSLPYDLASVCHKRYSPDIDFIMGRISQSQLANLFQEALASFSYRNDLDGIPMGDEPRVSLYGCLYNVEGIANGAYYYESREHSLQQIKPGDHRVTLQKGMSMDNVNLYQVPLCLHVVGEREYSKAELGLRGYRIQQMEAGILVQRLLLTASALRLGGHPLLGFDTNLSDEIYNLSPQGKTSLIQIPIGPYRSRPWLNGSLHS